MNVAFVSTGDPDNVSSWSGTDYFMPRALRDAGLSVDVIGGIEPSLPPQVWARRVRYRYLARSHYLYERDPAVGRRYAAAVERALHNGDHDVVFSVGGHPVAYLETPLPVVYWADATFRAVVGVYPDFTNVSARSVRDGDAMEAAALARSSLALFASDWAAESAIRDYGTDPAKVRVVPFGANIEQPPADGDVTAAIAQRSRDLCHLLFVGVDWERKRGAFAVDVARLLNERGIRTQLTVVGCNPSLDEEALTFTRVRGVLDKSDSQQRAELEALLTDAHFLLLPSSAECYGLVLCEANAFGVPVLATHVGGIPTIVRDGVNGRTFAVEAPPEEWAAHISSLVGDRGSYTPLAHAAHGEFRARLSWRVSGEKVRELLQQL